MSADCGMARIVARAARISVVVALLLAVSETLIAGPIHKAARRGNKAAVIALLKQNPDLVSSKDSLGFTPLHLAAKYDQPEVVALLLANGADVNAQTDVRYVTSYGGQAHYGESPLTLALQSYYHKEVVELLLTHGADVNVELSNGDTPLSMAIDQNLPRDVQVLLANGANPDYAIMNGQTAVHRAVIQGRLEILKLLLDFGANPNAKDGRGYTPLHYIDVPVYGSYQESQSTGFDNKIIAVLVAHGGHK